MSEKNDHKDAPPSGDLLTEYTVTIRLVTNEGNPAKWAWEELLDDFVVNVESRPTGHLYRANHDEGTLAKVDFAAEPRHRLGQGVVVSQTGGHVMAGLLVDADEGFLYVKPFAVGGQPEPLARTSILSVSPHEPKAK